jgi:hypothetical protein
MSQALFIDEVRRCPASSSGRFEWPKNLVAEGRFELYCGYPIRVPAVPASIVATT